MSVLLQKPLFDGVSQKELAEQLEARKKCKDKLTKWFNSERIYYPNKLNIEQTSSERTAAYKAKLLSGETLLDVTGGFGVDSYFFAEKIGQVFHCEINKDLSVIASHNFKVLGQKNISCLPKNGIDFLKNSNQEFDWIYLDPSRRDDVKGKVFLLKDCIPNLQEHLPAIFGKTKNVLVKTSPLLDISQGLNELKYVKEIHSVAVQNEVKELLFVMEYGFEGDINIKTVNLLKGNEEAFDFVLQEEQKTIVGFSTPEKYLYEPNAAILKSGGFKSVATMFGLKKLHQHSHLYTSKDLIDFPGRRFEVTKTLPYSKRTLKEIGITKANITTRNFPSSVAELRKKHKIKDGGDHYLFFTTDINNKLAVLVCTKI
ncbi:THUMP-like domain-containing protein [Flagellimonas sp. 2504JD1-5]